MDTGARPIARIITVDIENEITKILLSHPTGPLNIHVDIEENAPKVIIASHSFN
jgi:ATP-dependent Clp protease ATP-binding subunit ClpA